MEYHVAKSYEHFHYDITKAYKNSKGKMVVDVKEPCNRCNGSGIAISHVCNGQPIPYVNDGGICYGCNGAGYFHKTIRLYTDKEYEANERAKVASAAKREAEREARMKAEYASKRAKWLEDNCFNDNLSTFVYYLADSYEVKDTLKSAGFRFSSNLFWHIAQVPEGYEDKVVEIALDQVAEISAWGEGYFKPNTKSFVEDIMKSKRPVAESTSEWLFEEKSKFADYPVVLKSIRGMESRFGWTQLLTFEDENSNILTWWTATNISAEVGQQILISGTVKSHDEYKGNKTTVVTRVKIKES